MKHTKILGLVGLAMAVSLASFGAMAAPVDIHQPGMEIIGMLGLVVNKENLNSVFVSLKTLFNNAFEVTPSTWERIAMKVPSTTKTNDYKWLSNFPRMKKWIGDKVVKALSAFKYTIENDDFEATVEVDRNDIDDDQLGQYEPQAKMAGVSAKELPDDIVYGLVNGAFTNRCFDGQYFCDTDHPVNGASVSNKLTAKLSSATFAAVEASFGTAYTNMQTFTDDDGRVLNVRPDVLLVGPLQETQARLLMKQDKLGDDSPNPYQGVCEVVVDARITGYKWFLLDTKKVVKPFLYQERKAPVFVEQTGMDSDDVFSRKKFKFGAEARAAGGYAFWQLAYGSDGTT